jgi:hypothetical protein
LSGWAAPPLTGRSGGPDENGTGHSGHLQRHRDDVDGRRVTLSLTPMAIERILAELAELAAHCAPIAHHPRRPR